MKIQIPTNCPVCNFPLVSVNDQLFCQSKSCPAQINKKLEHFAKTLGIKGLGEKTIEKLNLEKITDLYSLSLTTLVPIVGEKVSEKLIAEIEKSKLSSFDKVLAAMSIPLIGNTAAIKLSSLINTFEDITNESCSKAGLGEKATNNLLNWIDTEYPYIKDFLPFTFENNKKVEQVEYVGVVCITGKLSSYKNKAEATQELEKLGYKVTDTLTKSVSILIDEENKGSTKRKTAEERGLQIITNLKQFIGK